MPTLRILYDIDGWAHHHRARVLRKHAPADFDVSLAACRNAVGPVAPDRLLGETPLDVLLVLEAAKLGVFRDRLSARGWSSRLVGSWNGGWPRDLDTFHEAWRHADLLIVNSQEYWEKAGRPPRTIYLPNGVDLDTFRVIAPVRERTPRVLWMGSTRHRRLKGYD